ncbi:hypothetical protein E2C01_041759 [Portunus trituberculatus]|uniref:Uncharacterized protein n=1 Tax=Portunus trituberculatus TaxID=210409 RepID=A0A5B7FR82_PORTR|nr:hypothetical protein [Portunus trituberculatus]
MANGGCILKNGRDYYFHTPSVNSHVRDRRAQTLLARLLIGHTYHTQSYLLTRDLQPYCDDCLVPLTVRHPLVECPSYIELRHRYLYRCRGRDNGVYYISKVLGPECLGQGHDVFKFYGRSWPSPKHRRHMTSAVAAPNIKSPLPPEALSGAALGCIAEEA